MPEVMVVFDWVFYFSSVCFSVCLLRVNNERDNEDPVYFVFVVNVPNCPSAFSCLF